MRKRRIQTPSLPSIISWLVVGVSVLFVFLELQPNLLFANTTTAGGDMGAHVWMPTYVRDHLLPHGRLTGWSPDWYNGFPALHFYFPLPTILILLLDLVMPTNIAFKLVSVSGLIALPICAYWFAKLARLPFPAPACLAAATVPFLFDTGYTIFGGNIASTLAGEFAFSIGFALALLFLGLVAGGLNTGRRRWLAALLFGLVLMSHVLPTIFAFTGGCVLFAMRLLMGRRDREVNATFDAMSGLTTTEGLSLQDAQQERIKHEKLVHEIEEQLAVPNGADADNFQVDETLTSHEVEQDNRPAWIVGGWRDRVDAFRWAVPVVVFGGMLACWWLIPFVMRMEFMNDMGWEKIQPTHDSNGQLVASAVELYNQKIKTYADALLPGGLHAVALLAATGALLSIIFRRKMGIFFTLTAAMWALAFIYAPQGRLWNARFLPFWYFSLYMLCAFAIVEFGWGLADGVRNLRRDNDGIHRDLAEGMALVTPLAAFALAMLFVVKDLVAPTWWKLPEVLWHSPASGKTESFIPGWTQWNYSGYERKDAYPEFDSLVKKMDEVSKQHGCGRAFWEYESELNRFGTPMALMRLPTLTNGCVGSEEGLFFESSATVPYHFLNQSELSALPSRAMRGLPYPDANVSSGVDKMQMLGIKYYMAFSQTTQQEAAAEPRLSLLASVPAADATDGTKRTWNIYEVAGSQMVTPLQNLPAVLAKPDTQAQIASDAENEGVKAKRSKGDVWLDNSVAWYQDPNKHNVVLAETGPKNWPRVDNATLNAPQVPAGNTTVTNIETSDNRISFNVDQVGVPVLVKASYFPNWKVSGASGVFRVTPNSMVVVPTSQSVSLYYGRTPVDYLGFVLTLGGLGGIIWLFMRERREKHQLAPVEKQIPTTSA